MFSFLLLTLFAAASANVIFDGPCPEVKPLETFNFSELQGTWYEIAKYPNSAEDGRRGKCTTAEYTSIIGAKGKVQNSHIIDDVKSFIVGDITLVEAGKIMISYQFGRFRKDSFFSVLDTDYSSYLISYSCKFLEAENKHQVYSWIMSRNKSLGDSKVKVDTFINDNKNLDTSHYVYTDYSDEACKYSTTRALNGIHGRRH